MSARSLSFNRSIISFFVLWVVITGIAMAVGQILALLLSWEVGETVERSLGKIASSLLVGLLIGIGMGGFGAASQALLLRGRVDARRWIGGAIVGATLAMCLGVALIVPTSEGQPSWISGLLAGATLGLGAALGQWVALRGRLPGISRWAVASFFAHSMSVFLLFAAGGEGRELIALISSGLAFGLIGGLGAVWADLIGQRYL